MRVLLAAAPHRDTFGYSMPPPGLLRLGGELERRGIAVEIEDLAFRLSAGELPGDDRLADAAADMLLDRATRARDAADAASAPESARADCASAVGISVMGATLPIALLILERMRRALDRRAVHPRVQLWLGGPGTTGVDAAVLERFPFVDAVVRGEGEITVTELCTAVSARGTARGVRGVTWRDEDGRVRREPDREPLRDLSELAPYAWHLVPPLAAYKRITGEADGLVPIDSGRGCVYDCSFCTIGRFWDRRSRTLPAKLLADEVASLCAMPAAKSAYLCHDIFGANRGHALAFCAEMSRRAIGVPWEARARADHLDRELLEEMGRAGCYRVLIGVESADAAVRAQNQKGMRADVDFLEVVDDCARAGITPILSLILGLPGEDEAALRKSLDLCAAASLRAGVNVSLHLVNPQPGCELGHELGAASRPIEGIPPDMAFGAGETGPERALIAAHPDLFSTWSLLPLGEERLRDLSAIATALPDVLMRYPRTFALMRVNRGVDALDLYRCWRAEAQSFESFAAAEHDGLIDAALAWERALARQTADAPLPQRRQAPRGPRARGEVLRLDHDVPAICAQLARGSARSDALGLVRESVWSETLRTPTVLCVCPGQRARSVQTLRISAEVADVLALLDGSASITELEERHSGLGPTVERLAESGLVELPSEHQRPHRIPSTKEKLRA